MFAGGGEKRARPCLVYLTGHLLGQQPEDLATLSAAIELIHSYTLIIDDIQDDDDLRRGEPATHIKYGLNLSLLAASRLLFEGVSILHSQTQLDASLITALLRQLHAGQEADILSDNPDTIPATADALDFIFRGKTGALFELALLAGCGNTQLSPDLIKNLRQIGSDLDYLFQAVDDYLETHSSTEELGKPAQKDRGNKLTFSTLYPNAGNARNIILALETKLKASITEINPEKSKVFIALTDSLTGKVKTP